MSEVPADLKYSEDHRWARPLLDYQLQVVTLSVSDVDKSAAFYTEQAGFTLDVDYHPVPGFRVVQLTPPGSGCYPDRPGAH
jgi:catechol 2,3-dioxygenase-like lactoylglutathione lyase family enzyme